MGRPRGRNSFSPSAGRLSGSVDRGRSQGWTPGRREDEMEGHQNSPNEGSPGPCLQTSKEGIKMINGSLKHVLPPTPTQCSGTVWRLEFLLGLHARVEPRPGLSPSLPTSASLHTCRHFLPRADTPAHRSKVSPHLVRWSPLSPAGVQEMGPGHWDRESWAPDTWSTV